MDYYNSVFKADVTGEVYRGVIFNFHMSKEPQGPRSEGSGSSFKYFDEEDNQRRSVRRARTSITDYVKTNIDLNYFATYTLDPKLIDRYDSKEIYKKMRNWLSEGVRRKGLKYILIPEQHKDKAWHFHGFTNIEFKWNYGYQCLKEIRSVNERNRRIGYVISYVKKDMVKFNGRYYLHSRNLEKPSKTYANLDFEQSEGKCIQLSEAGAMMKIII